MKTISYNAIVARRLTDLAPLPLATGDWGRLGRVIRSGRIHVEAVLAELEALSDRDLSMIDVNVGLFQHLVALHKQGKDVRKRIHFFISNKVRENVAEIATAQEKGNSILESLKRG